MEAQRELLCRQAKLRFDAVTAERLAVMVEHLDDPDRLDRLVEWIITCESGEELLERVVNGHLPNGAPDAGSSD